MSSGKSRIFTFSLGVTVLGGLWYYFRNIKGKNISLTKWHYDYIEEIKQLIKKDKKSLEITCKVYHLLKEIEDYLYLQENKQFEEQRIIFMDDNYEYENFVFKAVHRREKYFIRALDYLEDKIDYPIEYTQRQLNDIDPKDLSENQEKYKKPYYKQDLPKLDSEKLKECLVFYCNTKFGHKKAFDYQNTIIQLSTNYSEVGMKVMFTNKYLLKDLIKKNYNIDEK